MSQITVSMDSAWEIINPLMNIVSDQDCKWGVFSIEDIDNAKLFLDLAENANRLRSSIFGYTRKRGGLPTDPVPSVTISSEVALSVAYLLEKHNAAQRLRS